MIHVLAEHAVRFTDPFGLGGGYASNGDANPKLIQIYYAIRLKYCSPSVKSPAAMRLAAKRSFDGTISGEMCGFIEKISFSITFKFSE